MSFVLSKNTIKEILYQKGRPSADSILTALQEELDKPAEKTDMRFISDCLDALLAIDNITPCAISTELPVELKKAGRENLLWRQIYPPKKLKFAAAACITFVILFFVNTLSTYAFDFNIASEFATWTKDKVSVRLTTSERDDLDSQAVFAEIQGQLLSNGLLHVQWPSYLPHKMDLDSVTVTDTDISANVSICLIDNKESLSINIAEYKSQRYLEDHLEVDILGYYTDGEMLSIGGKTAYYIANKNVRILCYADGLSRYVITSTYDKDVLIDIVKSMR